MAFPTRRMVDLPTDIWLGVLFPLLEIFDLHSLQQCSASFHSAITRLPGYSVLKTLKAAFPTLPWPWRSDDRVVLWENRCKEDCGFQAISLSVVQADTPLNPFLWKLSITQLAALLSPPVGQAFLIGENVLGKFHREVLPTLRQVLLESTPCEILAWNSYLLGAGVVTRGDFLDLFASRVDTLSAAKATRALPWHRGHYLPPQGEEGRQHTYFESPAENLGVSCTDCRKN